MTECNRETDVIVVGGGLAGICAALEAAAAGVNVLLFDQQLDTYGADYARTVQGRRPVAH